MKLDLTELLRKVGEEADLNAEEKVNFDEAELKLPRPVKVKLHLTNTGASVLIEGQLESEVELECSRCLKSFRRPVAARIEEEFVKTLPARRGAEIELKAQDFVYPIEPDNTLDLGEIIRQNLLLSLPVKPLCETACKGV